MPKEYDDTNRGAIFKNTEKDGDTDRDYSGTLNVGGREFWISGWIKTSKKSGKKFLSLSIKPKGAPKSRPDFDDEISL